MTPRYTIRDGVAWDTRFNCPVLWCDGSTLASREDIQRTVQRMNEEAKTQEMNDDRYPAEHSL